jgi:coenzyme F420-reducing hydrogenase gamma subunit
MFRNTHKQDIWKQIYNKVSVHLYREDFNSLDKFMALHFTVAGVPPAARRIQILLMNQPITFGMKGSN